MPEKFTNEEIIQKLKSCGYELKSEYKDANTKVDLRDEIGYLYLATPSSIYNGKNKLKPFHGHNPYSAKNINLWIKINKKPYILLSTTFINAIDNMEWKCLSENCGEIFPASWHTINNGSGCSFCAGKRVSIKNCLATNFPLLEIDWDYEKNKGLTPFDVMPGTHLPANWKCSKCGHKWESAINSRVRSIQAGNSGCPVCSGKILTDKNRLSNLFPKIAKEWHPTKNGTLTADDVFYGCGKTVWWLCSECFFEWPVSINNRTNGNKGCPRCAKEKNESKVAIGLKDYCEKQFDAIKEYRVLKSKETGRWLPFDIYIPIYNLFIEVHGSQHYAFYERFHRDLDGFNEMKNRDKVKEQFAKENGKFLAVDIRKYTTFEKALAYFNTFISSPSFN
jgi:rubredoxin